MWASTTISRPKPKLLAIMQPMTGDPTYRLSSLDLAKWMDYCSPPPDLVLQLLSTHVEGRN